MSQLIDRRENAGKNVVNRQRFIRRMKHHIKRAVTEAASKRSITEIDQGEKITIPARDISEPSFHHGKGGTMEKILPGNDQFIGGERVKRPLSGEAGGSGGDASNSGDGNDDFVFELTREEFLDIYFENLELPDLIKKELSSITTQKTVRAGLATRGIPTNINILRSMRQATGRRIAIGAPHKRNIKNLEALLAEELAKIPPDEAQVKTIQHDLDELKKKIQRVPYLDTLDLRYNNRIKIAAPTTQAVMFCIMDVSGSMDEAKKDIAKRFFILLYLFLTKNYKKIELVFIRHHTSAKEVTEHDFFYSRETGGTVVSSALDLLHTIITSRFPPNAWNIYVAQASDGDNWNADSPYCQQLIGDKIMPLLQYFAYVEIMPRHHQSLWDKYLELANAHENFAMQNIDSVADIYPVFHELFKRKTS